MSLGELLDYVPLALALLVMLIEYYGHSRKASWVAEVGIPVGGLTETHQIAVPLPLPRDWFDDYPIVSYSRDRVAYKTAVSNDSAATCLGVVTIYRYGNVTIFRYRCIVRPWIPAMLAGIGSTTYTQTGNLSIAAGLVALAGVIWAVALFLHKRKTDEEYHVLTADIVQRAADTAR